MKTLTSLLPLLMFPTLIAWFTNVSNPGTPVHNRLAQDQMVSGVMSPAGTMHIEYVVRVHLLKGLSLTGSYEVQLVNHNGALVVPAQAYSTAESNYYFTEEVSSDSGTRIARLVPVIQSDLAFLGDELVTEPVEISMEFHEKTQYPFDLYPQFSGTLWK